MLERRLRWILAGVALLTLFLHNTGSSNLLFIFWGSMTSITAVINLVNLPTTGSIADIMMWLGAISFFFLAIPSLVLLNVCLAAFPTSRLKKYYRIFLLIWYPVTWLGTLDRYAGGAWGLGLWAIPTIVTVAAVMELAFIIWSLFWNQGNKARQRRLADLKQRAERLLLGRWTVPIVLLLSIICYGVLACVSNPRFAFKTHQMQWRSIKPSAYYMVVASSQPDGGPWRWTICIWDDRPISVQPLYEYPDDSSWLDPKNPTIEYIFALVDRRCVNSGPKYCDLEFDTRFHYPKRVDSYGRFVIEVEQFVPCEEAIEGNCCPPHQ